MCFNILKRHFQNEIGNLKYNLIIIYTLINWLHDIKWLPCLICYSGVFMVDICLWLWGSRICNLIFIDQARLKVMKNYVNSKVSMTDIAVEEFKNLCPIKLSFCGSEYSFRDIYKPQETRHRSSHYTLCL